MEHLSAKWIILTEDDKDDVDIFREVLKDIHADLRIIVAEDGVKLMSILAELTDLPDLIFLDINMPRRNGFQCLREIKDNQIWNSIKVIMLSTSVDQSVIDLAYQQGADMYVSKCISYSQFRHKITQCLQFNWESIPPSFAQHFSEAEMKIIRNRITHQHKN